MPTIYDVAKAAKVSIASVSLVMNDPDTPRVGERKRAEILRAANIMGYRPSGIAKALIEGSSHILGLIVPFRDPIFFNEFIAEVLSGIQSCVVENQYHLMIYSHGASTGRVTQVELQTTRYVDGMIVLNTRMCSEADMADTIADLRRSGCPFVMVNGYPGTEKINFVGIDDRETGRLGVQFLVGKGHKTLALLGGSTRSPISTSLLAGFKDGLRKNKLPFHATLHVDCDYDPELIRKTARRWLTGRDRPSGIFCSDDEIVPELYAAIKELGLEIPRDVAVIGRGNRTNVTHLNPQLTTIAIPGVDIGRKSAELLIASLAAPGKPGTRIILPCHLIERQSA